MFTISAFDLGRLTLGLLAAGILGGVPFGYWLAYLPVPDRRPDRAQDLELAAELERTALALRHRAGTGPRPRRARRLSPSPAPEEHDRP